MMNKISVLSVRTKKPGFLNDSLHAISKANPRTIKVAATIPAVPSVEMLMARDRSAGMPEDVKWAAAIPV